MQKACENVLGVIMPCGTSRNYNQDKQDAIAVASQFKIDYTIVDLGDVKTDIVEIIDKSVKLSEAAVSNIAPRLRMATLYSIARTKKLYRCGNG